MSRIDAFQRMLDQGQDNALLRFSLGREYLNAGDPAAAIEHLAVAVKHDPGYSAAWRELGKAHERNGDREQARSAYEGGIQAAEQGGDKQAAREMQVFRKRLDRGSA